MDLRKITFTALFALAATGLIARQPAHSADGAVTGKVSALYVRIADGVYRPVASREFTESSPGKLYADVRFAESAGAPRAAMFVPVPDGLQVEPGDLVRALPASDFASARLRIAPLPSRDRIVGLDARHDTLAARNYGAPAGSLAAALAGFAVN